MSFLCYHCTCETTSVGEYTKATRDQDLEVIIPVTGGHLDVALF